MMTAMRAEPGELPETGLAAAYREHYRSLVRLAALLVDDVGTCEELVQDAFVAVFRRPDRVRDSAKLPAYLRSAVLNGARSHLRKRQVRRRFAVIEGGRAPERAAAAEAGALARDDQRAVLEAMRELPDRQRDVLALRYWGELSESEIADVLGIAPGTVKTHARRALEALADRLENRR
jgi:RNA polymerase sigma-70 factor (sigma-E family)